LGFFKKQVIVTIIIKIIATLGKSDLQAETTSTIFRLRQIMVNQMH